MSRSCTDRLHSCSQSTADGCGTEVSRSIAALFHRRPMLLAGGTCKKQVRRSQHDESASKIEGDAPTTRRRTDPAHASVVRRVGCRGLAGVCPKIEWREGVVRDGVCPPAGAWLSEAKLKLGAVSLDDRCHAPALPREPKAAPPTDALEACQGPLTRCLFPLGNLTKSPRRRGRRRIAIPKLKVGGARVSALLGLAGLLVLEERDACEGHPGECWRLSGAAVVLEREGGLLSPSECEHAVVNYVGRVPQARRAVHDDLGELSGVPPRHRSNIEG